MKIDWILIA